MCAQASSVAVEILKDFCSDLLVVQMVPIYFCTDKDRVHEINQTVIVAIPIVNRRRTYKRLGFILSQARAFFLFVWFV